MEWVWEAVWRWIPESVSEPERELPKILARKCPMTGALRSR
jgi:hypothetical protein